MAIPAIPSNLLVQQANGQVFLSWSLVPGATSYTVQRSTDQITYTTIASPTAPQYLDTAVVVGIQYYYQVAGVSASGTSVFTSAVSVIPVLTGQMSLYTLRRQSQHKADMVGSQFITDGEWNIYINQSYFELYDILVQKFGNEYFVAAPYQVPTTSSAFYNLPDGSATYKDTTGATARPFYKLLGVDLSLNAGNNAWITLKKFEFIRRNDYLFPQLTSNLPAAGALRYRTMGNQLQFIPSPAGNQLIQIWYIPRMTQLLQDTDICDGVSGWTEYITTDAAIKALAKEESDVSVLMAQKMALLERIESAAENRDAGEPETISATRNLFYGGEGGNGFNGPIGGN